MQEDLLRWYNTELAFLRRMGEEFAADHPKIASRLKLGPESSQDPHVERLIEAVAFLNARTRQKIDDDFPELANAVLEVLQPQFLAPIPSMMITQFGLAENEAQSVSGYSVQRGQRIQTEPVHGEPCRFRTGQPITLWPVEVESALCSSRPFSAPSTPLSSEAAAIVQITIRSLSDEVRIDQLEWSSLRLFLSGLPQLTFGLYETLLNDVSEIAIARSSDDPAPIRFDPTAISPVGFNADDLLLPGSERTAWEYRLLTEFFVFPQKFLFLDFLGLDRLHGRGFDRQMHLYLYLDKTLPELENMVNGDTFQLGCTTAINLFKQRADPVYLSQTEYEYHVSGDVRRPDEVEVYSIDRVTAQGGDSETFDFLPFYSVSHLGDRSGSVNGFWHKVRRDSRVCETDAQTGSDVFISFVDLSFETIERDDWIVDLETTCLNRDLPEKLPFGRGQPRLFLTDEAGGIAGITAMTAPTPTLRPKFLNHARWKLISHLSLDHLSLVGSEKAAAALREILAIYDVEESTASRNLIQAITKVESRRVTRRIREADYSGVCRGIEVNITFDNRFNDPKLFLLACVIERFLGQACSINSFSQMLAHLEKSEVAWKKWPPRTGQGVLL